MIIQQEYLEIKDYFRDIVRVINKSENLDRKRQREMESKYSLPDANSFGWMPAINLCYSFEIENNQIMYLIPFLPFYNFLSLILPQALLKCRNLFGTKDAMDVLSALYSVSGYEKIGSIDDYKLFLINNAYCYFILRNEKGSLCNKVFRLDLFRHILPNKENGYDFDGGLMHAYRHCSWKGYKLSTGNGESELNSLWELPLMIGKAILLDNNVDNNMSTVYKDEDREWQIAYHIDPDTKVYYLKTAFTL